MGNVDPKQKQQNAETEYVAKYLSSGQIENLRKDNENYKILYNQLDGPENSVKQGIGIRQSEGNVYLGDFVGLNLEGSGRLLFLNGDQYQGEFKNNKMHGIGKFYSVKEGQWNQTYFFEGEHVDQETYKKQELQNKRKISSYDQVNLQRVSMKLDSLNHNGINPGVRCSQVEQLRQSRAMPPAQEVKSVIHNMNIVKDQENHSDKQNEQQHQIIPNNNQSPVISLDIDNMKSIVVKQQQTPPQAPIHKNHHVLHSAPIENQSPVIIPPNQNIDIPEQKTIQEQEPNMICQFQEQKGSNDINKPENNIKFHQGVTSEENPNLQKNINNNENLNNKNLPLDLLYPNQIPKYQEDQYKQQPVQISKIFQNTPENKKQDFKPIIPVKSDGFQTKSNENVSHHSSENLHIHQKATSNHDDIKNQQEEEKQSKFSDIEDYQLPPSFEEANENIEITSSNQESPYFSQQANSKVPQFFEDSKVIAKDNQDFIDQFLASYIYDDIIKKNSLKPGIQQAEIMKSKYLGQVNEEAQMHGKGIIFHEKGDIYLGDFSLNEMHGNGLYIFSNNQRYEGGFQYGKRKGNGKYFYKTNTIFQGTWDKDLKRVGKIVNHQKNITKEVVYGDNSKATPKLKKIFQDAPRPLKYIQDISSLEQLESDDRKSSNENYLEDSPKSSQQSIISQNKLNLAGALVSNEPNLDTLSSRIDKSNFRLNTEPASNSYFENIFYDWKSLEELQEIFLEKYLYDSKTNKEKQNIYKGLIQDSNEITNDKDAKNDKMYIGEMKNGRFPDGKGICVYPNEDCYLGEFQEGLRNGFGILVTKSGLKIYGNFENDYLTGLVYSFQSQKQIVTQENWISGEYLDRVNCNYGDAYNEIAEKEFLLKQGII